MSREPEEATNVVSETSLAPALASASRSADGPPLLELDRLSKSFRDHVVLREISLAMRPTEVVALIGPSGGGKSTLLRCINYLEIPTSGTIRLEGRPVVQTSGRRHRHHPSNRELAQLRRRVGMVFQSFNLFPHRTALQNITLGQIHTLGRSRVEAERRARELLATVGLEEKADEYPAKLSGGQQQRVAIARALALDPVLMLFDEPTSAIDPELRVEVLSVMRKLANEGMTMLIVTHEMRFAEDVADRVIFLADGGILEEGPARQVLREPTHERTRRFLRAVSDR